MKRHGRTVAICDVQAADPPPAIVAIGDLHGYYPALEQLLDALDRRYRIFLPKPTNLLIPDLRLVFTGDYIDRGNNARRIIKRLQRLQQVNKGSHIVCLFGNHELLALEAYDFACELASEYSAQPDVALKHYENTDHGRNGGGEFLREFGRTNGERLRSYVRHMSRDRDVGHWMRSLLPYYDTTIGKYKALFLHGDLSQELLQAGALDRYKKRLLAILTASTADMGGTARKYGHDWLTSPAGIFWCRSFQALRGADATVIKDICEKAGVDFIVTGHTPRPPRIICYGGRIFDIDVGMTPSYWNSRAAKNTPWALLLWNDGRVAGFSAAGEIQEFRARTGQMELFTEHAVLR